MEEYSKMPDVLNSYGKPPQTSTSATPTATTPTTGNTSPAKGTLQSEYAARRKAKAQAQAEKQGNLGWRAELREYLADTPMDVDEDTDLLVYWAVCFYPFHVHLYQLTIPRPTTATSPPLPLSPSMLFPRKRLLYPANAYSQVASKPRAIYVLALDQSASKSSS